MARGEEAGLPAGLPEWWRLERLRQPQSLRRDSIRRHAFMGRGGVMARPAKAEQPVLLLQLPDRHANPGRLLTVVTIFLAKELI